jgi:hypothetical protein
MVVVRTYEVGATLALLNVGSEIVDDIWYNIQIIPLKVTVINIMSIPSAILMQGC